MITCRVVRDGVLANPVREVVDLLHESAGVVTPALRPYYRDVLDHVMKHLTAWAGIILVPTLIAGINGMNFHSMPELSWAVGYPLALGLMLASAGALYLAFKRRDWL